MVDRPRLSNRLTEIAIRHFISDQELQGLQEAVIKRDNYSALVDVTQVDVLKLIPAGNGLAPELLKRAIVVHSGTVVVDGEVPLLCKLSYLKVDGGYRPCGGFSHNRSCCPPYAPKPAETQQILNESPMVVLIQAEGLTKLKQQKQLHFSLLAFEKSLKEKGFNIRGSWSAGPCRVCPECLGEGNCRSVELRRYSMEGSGMFVFGTMDRIARLTGDDSWKLKLIESWGLTNQSEPTFKSVIAIAVG